jgi:outer membrane protein OmpA-like peptidoglycan-associated protein
MKPTIFLITSFSLLLATTVPSPAQGFLNRLKQAKDKAAQAASEVEGETAPDTDATPAPTPTPAPAPATAENQNSSPAPASATPAPTPIAAYQNYDFVPGDTVLFADDFRSTQDGEFPDQWELKSGQGAVNLQQGFETFTLVSGNYVKVIPRVKTKDYLGDSYTIEFDTLPNHGSGDPMVFLENGGDEATISTGKVSIDYHAEGVDLSGNLPDAIREDNYENHWHHIAIAVKHHQLKAYVDQYRVLVVPDMKFAAQSIEIGGVADQDHPIIFTNVRVASGGGMNLLGQKFTEAKIVTHGINFDVDKATLRPESMGTLNQIKRIMTDNPDLKFEVDGHTDNTGSAAHNLTLSQERADAVVQQLVSMGIPASRLSAKGFGDTKPIASNDTPEGKANNRRVEFVRQS